MNEMCKCVRHPLRSLYLRYYLLECCKPILPSIKTSGTPVTQMDAIKFLLLNFSQMVYSWQCLPKGSRFKGSNTIEELP
ncbi:hypothetical protein Pelo_19900 [Pelomyxa schiedti]|nr:hypothetical protein Pelo_19900 [Pelomyxa schiedti]